MAEFKPVITLDRSKKFSTVHGDRGIDDPLYRVVYFQDGLPFDGAGHLVPDDGIKTPKDAIWEGQKIVYHPLYTEHMRVTMAKKLTRLARAHAALEPEPEEAEPEANPETDSNDVDLTAYLRGQVNYPPFKLFKAWRDRYSRSHTTVRALVEDAVFDERLITEEEVAPRLMKMLEQQKPVQAA